MSAWKVMDILEEMHDVTPVFRLAVDVSANGVGPRLGPEMYRPRKPSNLDYWLTSGRNAWRPVVDYLEKMKWCLPEKGAGLRDFPGIERLFKEKGMSILYKGINHFKLSTRTTPWKPRPTPPSPTSGSTPTRRGGFRKSGRENRGRWPLHRRSGQITSYANRPNLQQS